MTITFIYLMIGLFIAWAIALILVAGGATYIENLVKKMMKEEDTIEDFVDRGL